MKTALLFYGNIIFFMNMNYMSVDSVLFPDNKKKKKRSTQDLPFIYQSAPPAVSCTNAASTSIISGSKAVDFASFAIGKNELIIGLILPKKISVAWP